MTILTYRGYQGSVDYEDGQLVIQLLHIDDFISATCDRADGVEKVFHELVDDYLATCAAEGREPNKPYKGSLNIRMTAELHRQAAMAATLAGASLNTWIVEAVHEKLRDAQVEEEAEVFQTQILDVGTAATGQVYTGLAQLMEHDQQWTIQHIHDTWQPYFHGVGKRWGSKERMLLSKWPIQLQSLIRTGP